MNLIRDLSKKTGIPRKDLDALLKIISYEIVEKLKVSYQFNFPELGIIKCYIRPSGVYVRLLLTEEAKNRLLKDQGAKPNEIVFE